MGHKNFFSIAIPTYEMHGRGVEFLEFNFKILEIQSFKDFEIIISDHSSNNDIKVLCDKWSNRLDIKYYKNINGIGKSSTNINHAIKNSSGEWIKIIFQDDFLMDNESLEKIFYHIKHNKGTKWVVTACEHTRDGINMFRPFYPKWNERMHLGINTFSSPSVLTIKNEDIIYFDERLVNLMDVEYYKRMYDKYGEPHYIMDISVVNRVWENSVTNTLPNDIKQRETQMMIERYGG
jgi:hypothetical protein